MKVTRASEKPPKLARALLRSVLPRELRDDAVEELDEKFAEYVSSLGARRARSWYWRQVSGSLHPRLWRAGRSPLGGRSRPVLATDWSRDVRFGLRMLAKTPTMTVVILVTLAVGIGFNGAMFSLANTILRNELPLEGAGDLLFIESTDLSEGRDRMRVSYADYRDFAAAGRAFDGLAGWAPASINLSDGSSVPERIVGSLVTPNLFEVLCIEPRLGRALGPDDARPGAERVALLGHGLWQTRYGGDTGVIGEVVRVNGNPVTIVGVLPEALERTPFTPEMWVPVEVTEERELSRDQRLLILVGRLAEGVSRADANVELAQIAEQIALEDPQANEGVSALARTYHDRFVETANRTITWILMGAVITLLLIACANVANLLIARSLERSREVGIRNALGASRWRVVRQMLIEALLLSSVGGVAAVGLAVWGAKAIEAAILRAGPAVFWDFSIKPSVYVFIAALSVGTSLVFGLAPALHATRVGVAESLKEGGRNASVGGARRLTGALVVVQLALAMVLLTAAGLMVRSTRNVLAVDWAVDPQEVLTMRLVLPEADYPEPDNIVAFHDELEQRMLALPGVESYALGSTFPSEGGFTVSAELEGLPLSDGNPVQLLQQVIVSPSYFDMAGARAARGRLFTDADRYVNDPVIVVEQRLAERYWPGEDPVGKRLRWIGEADERWQTVVGVVADLKQTLDLEFTGDYPVVYTPYRQEPLRGMGIMVRSALEGETLSSRLRQEVQRADADLPVFAIAPLEEIIGERMFGFRIVSVLFFLLGGIALFLSCLGIYAVMAFAVGRRQREIGIRVALGAQRGQVLSLVLRRALRQATVGIGTGLVAALAATRLLELFMYEVSPSDPRTFGLTLALLLLTALAASVVPARRATRVDPLESLRSE